MSDIVALVSRLVSGGPDVGTKEALSGLQVELERLSVAADEDQQTSRTTPRTRGQFRGPSATIYRAGREFLKEVPGQSLPPSSLTVRDTPRSPRRAGLAEIADKPRTTSSRTDQELDELLRPLADLAARTTLVGLTDRDGARQALAPYGDTQVRFAVRQALALAQAGTVKSPIGWLVTKARQGDEAFFPPPSSLGPAPPRLPPTLARTALTPKPRLRSMPWKLLPLPPTENWLVSMP